ncbi:Mov34/MPN/PAD-1 family protein [Pedobacter hartonius]|uniref:Integrative and conjugative element protein, VC0181 family n=1 Tax=Pedobacter hartonius TaxID=425514 RepID=A0A1H4G154_9SPHI|nr:Mov34/MPN/PAD-1 family protein [Pedobacter hartonius]SEB02462.1 integrative and conjugative element protein, VC0181 family [Pedobacter hartonius]
MTFENNEIGLSVEISGHLVDRIREAGLAHYPNEFGGILVGEYSKDKQTVKVSETILPLTYKSSKVSFDRGIDGLKESLLDFYNAVPSRIYVGEWHTHPNASPMPSWTDILAMRQIVAYEMVNINNPIMLILGLTLTNSELAFYVYLNNKLYKYENI